MTQHIREFLHDDSRSIPERMVQLQQLTGVSDLVRQLLDESWQRQDWDTFELAVIAAFDHPNAGMSDLLCTALESGPRGTPVEDILEVLGEIKDPCALGTLRRVLDNPPDWDEFHHTSVKSVWAIAATGTPEARDILEAAQRTGPEVVREWAASTLRSWPE